MSKSGDWMVRIRANESGHCAVIYSMQECQNWVSGWFELGLMSRDTVQ